MSAPLWVVTTYFNPTRSAKRLENFRIFRRYLDAPLLVVELAPPGWHQLDAADGDRVIALTGDDCIWQKERLINLGVSELPRHVRDVAWIDCDIVLERSDWPRLAAAHLETCGGMLQLFNRAVHVPRAAVSRFAAARTPGEIEALSEESIGAAVQAGRGVEAFHKCLHPDSRRANGDICSMGMAWAAPRAVVEGCGLYDGAIVGGGDVMIAAAALAQDSPEVLGRRLLNRHQYRHFRDWAERARQHGLFRHMHALPQTAWHLWHGDLADRGYGRRHDITMTLDFDPAADLEQSPDGAWRWTAPDSALARAVTEYFFSRGEV